LARESATLDKDAKAGGFDRENDDVDIARRLQGWQIARDQQLWKLILSPEFGERLNLPRLTRDLIEQMKKDLSTDLEWAAVEHHNTEHPHVHVVIRGVRDNGETLHLSRDYVQQGIRSIAGELCTRQLGYRTELDGAEAERREVTEKRFTSIDKRLLRDAQVVTPDHFTIVRNSIQAGLGEAARSRTRHDVARLAVLRQMGLAEWTGPNSWCLRRDFDEILRAMQRTADRQRTLAAHGALMSDERLHIEVLDLRQLTSVEGRVLVHGQDEQTERGYLMLEGTDAKVHFIQYTPGMELARSRGELKTNSFVRLRKLSVGEREMLEVNDLGDADRLLRDQRHLGEKVYELLNRGIVPTEDGWGGWLGKYQAALCKTIREIEEKELNGLRAKERYRDHSRGR
jgi:type IV secretory pathway VirD2 relaxase